MPLPSLTNRQLQVTTPLGADALMLVGFTGREAVSELFAFQLDLLADNHTKVPFEKLLGQAVTVHLRLHWAKQRYFNGIISSGNEGGRNEFYTEYRAEMVPHLWLWTRKVQSRIYQHLSIPDILKHVFAGLKVA